MSNDQVQAPRENEDIAHAGALQQRKASIPFHIMVKPIGPKCNLACEYCFYLEKEVLWERTEKFRMTDETLENFVRGYIQSQPAQDITFAWQGGEPTLMGVKFFERAVELQKKYGEGRRIDNAFQTNGTLLDDEWCEFLARENFLVGLSIDGPEKLHDAFRVKRNGSGSWKEVMRGCEFLKKHGVEWNTLTCVNRLNAQKPQEVYRFLKGIGSKFMQFIPIVERKPDAHASKLGLDLAVPPALEGIADPEEEKSSPVTPWSVRPKDYGTFLTSIYDRWVRNDVGKYYVQLFDVSLGKWVGAPGGGLCVYAETCGNAMALEHDGGLYACDHYVYPDYRLGNVNDMAMADMVDAPKQKAFGRAKTGALPKQCRDCSVRFACNGGCPKHRFETTRDGEKGLNYLCEGYYKFFNHADPTLRVMAQLYRSGQPPAAIMDLIKRKQVPGVKP